MTCWKWIKDDLFFIEKKSEDEKKSLPACAKYGSSYGMKNLQIKTSDNDKYCAVFDPQGLYCDFYTHEYNELYKTDLGKYLFTIKRCDRYGGRKSEVMIVEFFVHEEKDYFIFYRNMSFLEVRDMNNNVVKKQYCPEFIESVEKVNNNYYLVRCWVWQPYFFTCLLNINKTMANDEMTNYRPIGIFNDAKNDYGVYDHTLYTVRTENGKIIYDEDKDVIVATEDPYVDRLCDIENYPDWETPNLLKNYKKYDERYEFTPEYVEENYENELLKILRN
jgi:hypothetical protein